MCTIGAVALASGGYALFKNKDFARPNFQDRVFVSPEYFGPLGLETFARDPTTPNVYSGLSIGANRHGLLACVNHVKMTRQASGNYDRLTEVALSQGHNVTMAIKAIQNSLEKQPYWWGNLILSDGSQFAALEIQDQQMRVESNSDHVFRANHQPLFGQKRSPDGLDCSSARHLSAQKRMAAVSSLDDIFALLQSHDSGQSGICNHTEKLRTVYAYVLLHRDGQTTLYVAQGNPCQHAWQELPVPLGQRWSAEAASEFIDGYPGGSA